MRYDNLQDAMQAVRPTVAIARPRRVRFKSELHEQWHRRVEGQIRDCMHHHPRWFKSVTEDDRANFTRSLAKRIVGEILVDGSRFTVGQPTRLEPSIELRRERAPWLVSLWRSAAGVTACDCARRFFRRVGLATEGRVP